MIYGKPQRQKDKLTFAHPEMDEIPEGRSFSGKGLQPVYSSTEKLSGKGLSSSGIAKLCRELIGRREWDLPELFPTNGSQNSAGPQGVLLWRPSTHPQIPTG